MGLTAARISRWLFAVSLVSCVAASSFAAVPQSMNFQGRLADSGGNPITGTKSIVFSIFDSATAGTMLWTETQSVTVTSGIYSVGLGAVTPLPGSVFSGQDRWLQLTVGTDSAMTPRLKLYSVPYAVNASSADFAATAANLAFPEGLSGLVPVQQRISLTATYTVPVGRNFHLISVGSATAVCNGPNGYATWCDLKATGGSSLLQQGGYWQRYSHNILGPGTVLSSTSSAISFDISGFTIPAAVQIVLMDLAPGGSYTVPNGVNLYLVSVGEIPNVIGSGQVLTNPNTSGCVATINGYLK